MSFYEKIENNIFPAFLYSFRNTCGRLGLCEKLEITLQHSPCVLVFPLINFTFLPKFQKLFSVYIGLYKSI